MSQEFPQFQPWQAQPKFDAVVSALWRCLCPNHKGTYNLDLSCLSSNRPEICDISLVAHAVYTNYFDPVTEHLPINTSLNRQYCNLRLSCFDTWADAKMERETMRNKKPRSHVTPHNNMQTSGPYLSRLSQYGASGPMSTKQYLYHMYGYHCR